MMSSRKRIIYTLFLWVLSVIFFMMVTLTANRLIFADRVRARDTAKLEAIDRIIDGLSSSLTEAEQKTVRQYEINAVLTAKALSHVIGDLKDDAIMVYQNGAVIKIEKGQIRASADTALADGLTADLFPEDTGYFPAPADPSTLVVYSRIASSPYYYLEWYEDTDLHDIVEQYASLNGLLSEAEAAYGSNILLVRKEDASDTGMAILFCNDKFSNYKDTSAMGLTAEEIEQSVGLAPQGITLNGGRYKYSVGEVPSLKGYAILLVPETDILQHSMDQIGGLVSILILILCGMVVTGLSLYDYALRNKYAPEREKRYEPVFVRKTVVAYGISGLLFIGFSSACLYSLNGLHEAAINGRDALEMLEKRIILHISQDSNDVQNTIDSYLTYGNHISELLAHNPQLRTAASLEELAECIDASSITLYDHTGREIVSSNDYIDMSLGTGGGSTTSDFRRILKGVPYIVHEAETDETTGRTEVRIGIRTDDFAAPGKYGVMLISLDPALIEKAAAEEISNTLLYMSEEDTMLWIAESGTGTILAASDSGMTGKNIYAIGMGENDLTEGLMKDISMDDGQFFVISSLLEDPVIAEGAAPFDHSVAYYAVNRAATNYGIIYTVANSCLLSALVYILLAWFILRDYTEEFYENRKSRSTSGQAEAGERASGNKKAIPARNLWRFLFGPGSYWGTRRPEQKGFIVTEAFLALFLLQQIPLLAGGGRNKDSLYYYLMKGLWEKGVNLFAVTRILIMAGEMILFVIVVNFVLRIIGRQLGAKGWTVCRLLMNFVKYLCIASFIGLSLYNLGIDKTTLLAAVSILSLAVSLGSQSLIADIIAGISIILEGVFDVGDEVVIGEYKGKVLEIGVRSTRILCHGNDVMVIGNKEIKTVLNKSQKNTVFDFVFTIRSDYPVDVLRALLDRALPEIAAGNSRVLGCPVFEGISQIEDGKMTLVIATECRQADYGKVKLYMNSELQKLFAKNGIRI